MAGHARSVRKPQPTRRPVHGSRLPSPTAARARGPALTTARILDLQGTIGNRRVGPIVARATSRPEAKGPVIQRWEDEAVAKANEIMAAKRSRKAESEEVEDEDGGAFFKDWPTTKQAALNAGKRGAVLSSSEADPIWTEYKTKAPVLPPGWLVSNKSVGLSRPLMMDIDGPLPDLTANTTELSDLMKRHLAFFPRTEHLAILNFLDTLARKRGTTPEERYWNLKMPQFRAAMKKHLVGSGDESHNAMGYLFSRGRATDASDKVVPWIEPGTLAEPKQDTLTYRSVDKATMTPAAQEQQLAKNQVHAMEMYRFTSEAPAELKKFALISWYQRGAKKKATDFAKQDKFQKVGQEQVGFAKPTDLRPFFGVMVLGKLNVESQDLSAIPLWDAERGPQLSDIKQGVQGNCWALAALASLVSGSPGAIKNMLKDNGDGTVTCRFYDETTGRPEWVTVTKSVVGASFWGVRYHIANRGAVTWPVLILKAYASWLGSGRRQTFQAFDSGESHIAFGHFTGAPTSDEQADDPATVKALVLGHLNKGDLVAAGTPSKKAAGKSVKNAIAFSNVQKQHAYSVLSANDKNIVLHNPWGKQKFLSLTGTGRFSLTWKDFTKKFEKVYIGKLAQQALAAPPDQDDV